MTGVITGFGGALERDSMELRSMVLARSAEPNSIPCLSFIPLKVQNFWTLQLVGANPEN